MICLSCSPSMCDARQGVARRASTAAGRIVGAVRCRWRSYWSGRASKAIVLMLRMLDERTLRDIGIDPSEIAGALKDRGARCQQR
jgi:uncharacterized protein YjiS (DUF1127 family)